MVDVPKVSFFSAEGGLLLEAHKLRSFDARFRAAREELGKCTVQELRRLEGEEFKIGRESRELREFLARFKNNFYNLLKAYTEVVQEIDRILGLISQSEYEDLLSLKQVLDKVVSALRYHRDWFVYDSDVLSDYNRDFMATIVDLNKKLVDEYSLKQTVGAHGKSTLLRLRAFLKSRGFIERYAEAKAMRAGRVYRQAKKKSAAVEEKIQSGENFLPALKEYLHHLDALNQLLHILALDILTVFSRFEDELNGVIPILLDFIKQILNPQLKAEMQAKHREFSDEYLALRRRLENPQWANVSTTLGKTVYDEAWELMSILSSRSREGPRTRGVRVKKETKERKKRERSEAKKRKREKKELRRKARQEAIKKKKEALISNLKKKWWRVRHVTTSTAQGLKEGWIEGGKKQQAKRDEKAQAREKARERQDELRKGVQPTPGPKMNLLRSKEVQERLSKRGQKEYKRWKRQQKWHDLKKRLAEKWGKVKHVTTYTAQGLKEGWVEGGMKQEAKKDERKRAREEAKRLKKEEKEREQKAAQKRKEEEDQAKAQAREEAQQERQKKIDALKKKLAGKWWKVKHVTSSTAEGLREGWVEGGKKQQVKKEEKARAREDAKRLKKEEKEREQKAAQKRKEEEDQAKAQAREERERVRDQAKLAVAERWRLRRERVARLFRRSPESPSESKAEATAADLARKAAEKAGEKTTIVRERFGPRRARSFKDIKRLRDKSDK